MVDEAYIGKIYQERRQKHAHRLDQGRRVRDILANKMDIIFKDVVRAGDEPVVGNLIWAAARTITQRVGRMPRLDAQPVDRTSERAKAAAETHEARLNDYNLRMNLSATRLQAAHWLVCHDMAPLVVRPSPDLGIPVIEVRDPLSCLPGSVFPHKPDIVNVLFAEKMNAWTARTLYPAIIPMMDSLDEQVENVVIGEFFDNDGITTVMLEPRVCKISFLENPVPGKPMVFMSRGFSVDMDYHGQFDHVVAALVAQAKLFSMVMAYASQQVAAETVVVGEVTSNQGRWATGPGAVNNITPMPGASATKLINSMSPQVFNELDRLERAIRLGGQFPAQLSGEPVASIATGKGLEQLTVTVDDNVAYWQSVLDDTFMRAYSAIPRMAKRMGSPGAKDFMKPDDVTIYVRSLSGADPAETVRMLQLQGAKTLGRLTIMERLPEIDAPLKEMERMDVDDMRQTLIRALDQQITTGQMDADDIAKIIQRRKKGEEIEDIWEELSKIQAAQAQAQQQQQSQVAQQAGPSQAGQQLPKDAPPLDQLLNPAMMTQQSRSQIVRSARSAPQNQLQNAATQGSLQPPPGAGPPGPVGIPQ